ncbi:hypothetical protein HK405_003159 [Cladochytrium tenue]|nr:hypothetical protein HK405_003159 [Cladochytrium tenue]
MAAKLFSSKPELRTFLPPLGPDTTLGSMLNLTMFVLRVVLKGVVLDPVLRLSHWQGSELGGFPKYLGDSKRDFDEPPLAAKLDRLLSRSARFFADRLRPLDALPLDDSDKDSGLWSAIQETGDELRCVKCPFALSQECSFLQAKIQADASMHLIDDSSPH